MRRRTGQSFVTPVLMAFALATPAMATAIEGPARTFWRFEQDTHTGNMSDACLLLTTGLMHGFEHTVGRGLDCPNSLRHIFGWPTHPMARIHASVDGRRAVVSAGTVRAWLFREDGAWWIRKYQPPREGLNVD